uniref:tRNA-intron lyase n=1 Tax=Spongospora subterranea TaxID=70186 RepID=A0A0H5R249_9EUKA|eukprot:CRZ01934.1 hypothetical protein [Spongospora subterranea]
MNKPDMPTPIVVKKSGSKPKFKSVKADDGPTKAFPDQNAVYRSVLRRNFVIIESEADADAVYKSGFFGKGSLRRSGPGQTSRNEIFYLLLVEAFYLLSVEGYRCLTIFDEESKRFLDEESCWDRFSNISPRFPAEYAGYYKLRLNGWVPKSGIKFGVDFVIYVQGPAYYHARYSVIIVEREDREDPYNQRGDSWVNLTGDFRQFQSDKVRSLKCHLVSCRIATRWTPETSRESAIETGSE